MAHGPHVALLQPNCGFHKLLYIVIICLNQNRSSSYLIRNPSLCKILPDLREKLGLLLFFGVFARVKRRHVCIFRSNV